MVCTKWALINVGGVSHQALCTQKGHFAAINTHSSELQIKQASLRAIELVELSNKRRLTLKEQMDLDFEVNNEEIILYKTHSLGIIPATRSTQYVCLSFVNPMTSVSTGVLQSFISNRHT